MTETDAAELRDRAREAGLEIAEIRPDLDIEALVADRIDSGRRLFIAAGGDGTIHHLLQSVVGTSAVLGVIPLGTVNHLARDLGIPLEWRAALEVALTGTEREIDVAVVNGRYFVNNMMLGFYPSMVYHRERLRGTRGKWGAWAQAGWAALRTFPHIALALESPHHLEAIRTQLFTVAVNAYDLSQPGMVAERTTLHRGRLAVYWLPFMNRLAFARTVARYARGSALEIEGFRQMETSRLRISSARPRFRMAIDGELVEMSPPLTISIVPRGLNVRLPV